MHFIYTHDHQAQNILANELLLICNVVNNTTTINNFNSDKSNIANSKTQYRQIMRTVKSKLMIKKPVVTDKAFFTDINFSQINSFT